ncbi:hypothetical protein PM082_004702 [Marasmius tenuissimus]|nr:hypothetical protein PM082_004702 [Marasmius tenuissimus]
MELFSELNLYIPSQNQCEVNAKLACAESKPHELTNSKVSVLCCREHAQYEPIKERYNHREYLFQCQAGVDHTRGRNAAKTGKRNIPWANIDCTCWIKVVVTFDTQAEDASYFIAINQLSGVLLHSEACQVLFDVENDPPIPLHPLVRSWALELILQGSSLYFLRTEIKEFVQQIFGEDAGRGSKSHHFFLESHDTSTLYCTARRFFGVRQRTSPEKTLDSWFHSHNPTPPSPLVQESCLHYQPQLADERTSRFELVIATPDMKKAAWDHAHNQHLLMDLTFGFCSSSLLLTLLMAFNSSRHGVPVGALLFSARKDAKATHADYNTQELTKLVGAWKDGLGTNSNGEKINIKVAMTDQDPRERNTLSAHWPEIFLLLCIFHVWQSWKNALNRYLRCIPEGDPRKEIRCRLAKLLHKLMREITSYADATWAYEDEREYILRLGRRRSAVTKKQAKGGLLFLNYLQQYHLKSEDYWMSWSPAGALEASQCLDIPVEQVPRTNNTLEGFNGRIKGQYIAPYTWGRRLPRVDVWVYVFITFVIPELFKSFHDKEEQQKFRATFRSTCPTSSKPSSAADVPATPEGSKPTSPPSTDSSKSPKSKIQVPEFTIEELEKEEDVKDEENGGDHGEVLIHDSDDEVGDEELKELAACTSLLVEETQIDMSPDEPALDADGILPQLCKLKHCRHPSLEDDFDSMMSPPSSPLPSHVDDTYEPSPPVRHRPQPPFAHTSPQPDIETPPESPSESHVSETLSSISPMSSSPSSDSLLVNAPTTPNQFVESQHVTTSRRATAVMELTQAQMAFVDAAKRFIALTNDTNAIYSAVHDIKQALGLDGTSNTSTSFSLPSGSASPSTPSRTPAASHSSQSPPIYLSSPDSTLLSFEERASRVLQPLEKQTKSRRKPSHKVI